MKNTKFVFFGILCSLTTFSVEADAQIRDEVLEVSVTEVIDPNPVFPPIQVLPTPTNPVGTGSPVGCGPLDPICSPGTGGGFDFSTILTLGQKVWDFILTNKPSADYKTLRASVLPGGATSWSQLKGWSKPISKVYHVDFKTVFGKIKGGFDYRIVFIYGGNYQGRGKYIGQISFTPVNIKLNSDHILNVKAELLDAMNFGTEEDPIAGAQLLITWSSSRTLRYSMDSIEYFLYGSGEFHDISNGTAPSQGQML